MNAMQTYCVGEEQYVSKSLGHALKVRNDLQAIVITEHHYSATHSTAPDLRFAKAQLYACIKLPTLLYSHSVKVEAMVVIVLVSSCPQWQIGRLETLVYPGKDPAL